MRGWSSPLVFAIATLSAVDCGPRGAPPESLVVLNERDVEALDPHTAGELWQTQTLLANLYEGLVAFDAGMALVPGLAVSWSNPDDHTWEFALRSGVRFHTGGTLDAEDVVYSLRRARDHPGSVLRASLAGVEEIAALPGDRVKLRTREPDATLVFRLRDAYVVSRRFVEKSGEGALASRSSGTGPYSVASRTPGSVVDLERFDTYWKGPASFPRARFVARAFGDPDAMTFVPRGGRVLFGARSGTKEYERASREAAPRFGLSLAMTYLSFDLRNPTTPRVGSPGGRRRNPFLDRRVREAVALALDLAKLNRAVTDGEGFVPTQMVPPVVFGFEPSLPPPREDKAAARDLLKRTPFGEGFDVELDLRDSMAAFGAPVADDLRAIGIRASMNVLSEQEFFRRVSGGGSSLYGLRFSCRTGDAQEFLDKWVHSRDPARGYGEFNFSYDTDPVPGLDQEIEEARRELDPGRRSRKLQQAMRRFMEMRLAIPLLYGKIATFTSPDVEWSPRADTFRLAYEARVRR